MKSDQISRDYCTCKYCDCYSAGCEECGKLINWNVDGKVEEAFKRCYEETLEMIEHNKRVSRLHFRIYRWITMKYGKSKLRKIIQVLRNDPLVGIPF